MEVVGVAVKKFELMLYAPGVVMFDPLTLHNFLVENNIVESNLLKFFSNNEKIGQEVISQGCIIPIYEIPVLDYYYHIIINPEQGSTLIPEENHIFTTKPFPLKITSGNLILSDISAIIDWDKEYYLNYEDNKDKSYDNCKSVQMSENNYSVSITGYYRNNLRSNIEFGYVYNFSITGKLPKIDFTKNIDEYNFAIDPENRSIERCDFSENSFKHNNTIGSVRRMNKYPQAESCAIKNGGVSYRPELVKLQVDEKIYLSPELIFL